MRTKRCIWNAHCTASNRHFFPGGMSLNHSWRHNVFIELALMQGFSSINTKMARLSSPLSMLIMGSSLRYDRSLVNKKKHAFLEHWECHDTSGGKEFLGMCVSQTAQSVEINQFIYLKQILTWFDMQNVKITPTPLPTGYNPEANTVPVDPTCQQEFQQVIESLLYLMLGTRPDITFAVIKMSQFSANPSQDHLDKVKYIL